jgi:microcompartment protein CcmK/EutM
MRVAKVIGTVTLNRSVPSFAQATLKLAVPQSLANLSGAEDSQADTIVVWDELGAGVESLIAMSEGGEAAQPFRPALKPVDAYNAALLDTVSLKTEARRASEV